MAATVSKHCKSESRGSVTEARPKQREKKEVEKSEKMETQKEDEEVERKMFEIKLKYKKEMKTGIQSKRERGLGITWLLLLSRQAKFSH